MTRPARIAMLGGTFDPVHNGHLRSALELRDALGLDAVHMIPAPQPPLRDTPQVSPRQRLALLETAIADTPGLKADARELERDGPSYSVDTLRSLRDEYGEQARLVMAIGWDAFLRLDQWRAPEQLFAYAHLVVIARPGHEETPSSSLVELLGEREVDSVSRLMAKPHGRLLHVTLPSAMAISATHIRQWLGEGKSIRYLVPEAVENAILHEGLYQRWQSVY
ncbi:nicotinate-nucleotide adenylyltransferase [Halomonas sp. CUBES01]|uniref:Probable nicotinate-nucleotide adenylyltransferase n=1 Tax=Vreelandella gomseomensis TaxID=370766 RepID=A0ABU1GC50_9GAMM|nr:MULTISPECIES: nicotinate-nucleotide adenylyltransferase [Halomonas]MDR5874575.1 nicotinate-nucleotide adenylyltransferase [Halomonas gomseomensis]MEC4767560.1 nicotinate-nucleotide adenylyltransferase [Halomonas sp. CUBES01]